MENYIRDTVFGDTVRLLSNNKLLKFPDEKDPKSWKQFLHEEPIAPTSTSEKETNLASSANNQTDSAAKQTGNVLESPPAGRSSEHASSCEEAVNSGHTLNNAAQDVILIDWYGPSDPEVCITSSSLYKSTNAETSCRILKTGRHATSFS